MKDAGTPDGFREPQQARSRRTLARIAEATEAILLEEGPEHVTVRSVVDRAETSVGAFYTRFRSRDDAVEYLHDRFWSELLERWTDFLDPERWQGIGAAALVAEVVRRYARISLADDRGRALLVELLARRDEALLERIRTLDGRLAALMADLLEARAGELEAPRLRDAAEAGFLRVLDAVRSYALFGPRGGRREQERLILSLIQMYAGLLGVRELPGSYVELVRLCVLSRGDHP